MTLGEQLKQERITRGIRSKDLAEQLLITKATLWRLETNKQEVTETYLRRYAGVFKSELVITFVPKT